MVTLTAGELMTNLVSSEELAKINMDEARKAATILGVKEVRNLGFRDTDVTNREEIRVALNDTIRELKPDIIITHWPLSTHPDFRETAQATIDACFFALLVSGKWAEKYKPHWTARLYAFEVPELSVDFKSTALIDVTDCMDMKIRAAKCFKMHIDAVMGGDVDKWINSTCIGPCRYWGLKAGVTYAEPFRQIEIHETHFKAIKYLS